MSIPAPSTGSITTRRPGSTRRPRTWHGAARWRCSSGRSAEPVTVMGVRNLLVMALLASPASGQTELARWRAQADRVEIVRDDWGIAHVTGRTDADAVFGAVYAQAEDDFPRVEANYLTSLGRTAEAEGEEAIWAD